MLNVEELVCPELRLAVCHVKEAMRAVLHTILVCRSMGGIRPIEPRAFHSELLDLSYMRTDEAEFDHELEQSARQFSEIFEEGNVRTGRAQLVLSFFTEKPRKQSVWNILVGADEKIVFEQWRVPLAVQPQRWFPTPEENLCEEANLQASASQQVQQVLQFVLAKVNAKVDHLPPAPQSQAAYRFEIAFATADGRSLDRGSALLPQGLSSALSKTIKNVPKIA